MFLKPRKHNTLDWLIFNSSGKTSIIEKIIYNSYLRNKKMNYISQSEPIVIGGCPRSGTTLARALIGSHPDIASIKKEFNLLIWITNKEILRNALDFSKEEIESILLKGNDHIKTAENILKLYLKKNKKNVIAVKHPNHILIIDYLFKYFPEMKFIHIIRDGRDVACSLRTHPKRKILDNSIIPIETKNPFNWCVRRWVVALNLGEKWKNSKNYIEIRYEDLVNNTLREIKKVFDFLGLKKISDSIILNYYKSQNDKKHIQNIEVGKPIYKDTIGRWRKDLNDHEKKIFKKLTGDLLIKYGYTTNNNW
jgi:hypothetical protein